MTSFIEHVWGGKPPGSWLYLWTLHDKRSHWFQDLAQAQKRIDASHLGDLYISVGIGKAKGKGSTRLSRTQIAGIPGLWLDLDVAGDGHKKTDLPSTKEAALAWVYALPLAPTLIVDSGHGYQCWWIWGAPWLFEPDSDESRKAEAMSKGWSAWLQARTRREGWSIDSTWDLARILRVPGTTNTKAEPVPVVLVSDDGPRYNHGDFADYQAAPEAHSGLSVATTADALTAADIRAQIVLRADAEAPEEKLLAITEADSKFRASWHQERRDMKDQSPSAYDMSIASMLAGVGWSAQEITDACIHWRRRFKHDQKLDRPDYWALTVGEAIRSAKGYEALRALQIHRLSGEAPTNGHKQAILAAVSARLEFRHPLEAITRYVADPDVYTATVGGRAYKLGGGGGTRGAGPVPPCRRCRPRVRAAPQGGYLGGGRAEPAG